LEAFDLDVKVFLTLHEFTELVLALKLLSDEELEFLESVCLDE
jgi:hypothetical protein